MICPNHFSGAQLIQMQTAYTAMFQAGWFVESMWSQTLVIHMIRTPKIPFIQSHASAPLTLLTCAGIAVLTIIPFTPFGAMLGFVALPFSYFAYLIPLHPAVYGAGDKPEEGICAALQ